MFTEDLQLLLLASVGAPEKQRLIPLMAYQAYQAYHDHAARETVSDKFTDHKDLCVCMCLKTVPQERNLSTSSHHLWQLTNIYMHIYIYNTVS